MSQLKPFKAVRPRRDLVHLVASRPVYTYKQNILEAKLEENPFTFIQIINPEYFENDSNRTEPNTKERFEKVKHKFDEFVAQNVFIQEEEESLYVYRQTKSGHEYLGVIAGASVHEYSRDLIKKHEATLTSREEMFTDYLEIVGFNAEPVLLFHPDNLAIDQLLSEIIRHRPEYEFTTTDMVKHELWVVQGKQCDAVIQAYANITELYIADGHHRSASSAKLFERLNNSGNPPKGLNHAFCLSFIMSESRLNILPFNRLVKTDEHFDSAEFLNQLKQSFEIKNLNHACEPTKMHDIHYFDGENWFCLTTKPEFIDKTKAVGVIDAEILTQTVLAPILGIKDLKTDPRIGFVSGENSVKGITDEIQKGKFNIGFALFPVTTEQLKAVADDHAIMPPKSTWVEPKLRSGLTIYKIDE
jgi:uncharacterized protein (DUF1015 family)